MTLNEYLDDLLGEREARKLRDAISAGKTILITGPQGPTGKTTLCLALKKAGVPAVEQWEVREAGVHIPLKEVYEVRIHTPLKELDPHMDALISC